MLFRFLVITIVWYYIVFFVVINELGNTLFHMSKSLIHTRNSIVLFPSDDCICYICWPPGAQLHHLTQVGLSSQIGAYPGVGRSMSGPTGSSWNQQHSDQDLSRPGASRESVSLLWGDAEFTKLGQTEWFFYKSWPVLALGPLLTLRVQIRLKLVRFFFCLNQSVQRFFIFTSCSFFNIVWLQVQHDLSLLNIDK